MQIRVTLDDKLVATAKFCTGIEDMSALANAGLNVLLGRKDAWRLARMGETEPNTELGPCPDPRDDDE